MADRRENAGRAEHHIGEVIVIADAGQHHVSPIGGFGRTVRYAGREARVRFLPALRPVGAAVVNRQAMSGLADVPRDRAAHHAKAQERNVEGRGHKPGV